MGSEAFRIRASAGHVGPRRNRLCLGAFMIVVGAHCLEHLVQAVQIYLMGTPTSQALGLLGEVSPALVSSEWLHFGYNLAVLVGAAHLLPLFAGSARTWWAAALWVQAWHFFEHGLLFAQAQGGFSLFGAEAPTSVVQLLIPRVELHLFYNAIVAVLLSVAFVQKRVKETSRPADPDVETWAAASAA